MTSSGTERKKHKFCAKALSLFINVIAGHLRNAISGIILIDIMPMWALSGGPFPFCHKLYLLVTQNDSPPALLCVTSFMNVT